MSYNCHDANNYINEILESIKREREMNPINIFFGYSESGYSKILEIDNSKFYLSEGYLSVDYNILLLYKKFRNTNNHHKIYRNFLIEKMKLSDDAAKSATMFYQKEIANYIIDYMKCKNTTSIDISDVVDHLNKFNLIHFYKSGVYNIISRPKAFVYFGRLPKNKKCNTFDFIDVEFRLISSNIPKDVIKRMLYQYKKEIQRLIILSVNDKLQSRYGIPMNCLKIDTCTLTSDCRLIYKLSLKEIKAED